MKKSILFILPLFLLACGGSDTASTSDAKMLESRTRIRAMEDSIFDHGAFDQRSMQSLVDVYKAYAVAFPNDSLAPEFLFRASTTVKSMHDPEQAIMLCDRVIKTYPEWRRIVDVLYMKALTLDDDLDQKGAAKTAYEQVIQAFPDHQFARDSKVMIENLEYTDEELIERFKQRELEEAAAKK